MLPVVSGKLRSTRRPKACRRRALIGMSERPLALAGRGVGMQITLIRESRPTRVRRQDLVQIGYSLHVDARA